jgi:hypothetical protein
MQPQYQATAVRLLDNIRVHESGDGPAFGAVKAQAATAYALLAVAQAIQDLASEVGSVGSEASPIFTREA